MVEHILKAGMRVRNLVQQILTFSRIHHADSNILTDVTDLSEYEGNETILVVDDEDTIVHVASELLANLGYQVEVKTDSQEALTHFQNLSDRFDLVLSDINMPKMTGDKLAQRMLSVRPNIPVVLAMGFITRTSLKNARKMGVRALLLKPFLMKQLARTIRRALDGKEVT